MLNDDIKDAHLRPVDAIVMSSMPNRIVTQDVRDGDVCGLSHGYTPHHCPQIVSQIDNPSAVSNFDDILEVSDGIMVSRAHLGIRLPSRKV
jgi:pyruvate kinase